VRSRWTENGREGERFNEIKKGVPPNPIKHNKSLKSLKT